jgi:hypothetical protein
LWRIHLFHTWTKWISRSSAALLPDSLKYGKGSFLSLVMYIYVAYNYIAKYPSLFCPAHSFFLTTLDHNTQTTYLVGGQSYVYTLIEQKVGGIGGLEPIAVGQWVRGW